MGGKSGGGEAEAARRDEQRRQDKIRAGTSRINSIFDGGTYRDIVTPTGKALDFDSGEYYDASGKRLSGKILGFDNEVVFGPEKKTAGQFTPEYYNNVQQDYVNYATPQLEDQYGKAQKELTFALARGGNLDSSARAQKEGELQQGYDLNKQKVADDALAYKTKAQTSVEDARANLVSMLNATGDAEGAAKSALSRASALSQPAAYSPLSSLFADFTAGLGTQAALEKANYYSGGQTGARYSTGLFTPSSSAVKVS
jgi:hypothetical protein